MKPIQMILGPRKDIPGGGETHLRVVRCGKKKTPPGPQSQQVMPVTLDHKGKAQQKQRSGCSLGTRSTQRTFWTRLLLPSFGNLYLLPICLPLRRAQLPTPPSAELILQPGPAASAPRQRGQATAGAGVLPPAWPNSKGPASDLDHHRETRRWSTSKRLPSQEHPPHSQEVGPWCTSTQPSWSWSVVKAQGGTQTASKFWQPAMKPVLLQHQAVQPTLDYKQSGYCDTFYNAVFQLQRADTPCRSRKPADDYRSTVECD